MSWLGDTIALYARVFRRAGQLVARCWILPVVAVAYTYGLLFAAAVSMQLGLLGGFVQALATAALGSSWLSLLERAVRQGRADASDVAGSFGTYLSDLLTVSFLLWVLSMVATLALAPFPFLQIVFALATVTFFNAVPELIYLGRHGAAELLAASYAFIGENWIEWFPATIVIVVVVVAVGLVVPAGPWGAVGATAIAIVATYGWLVRGLLFLELTQSSRRAREFQRRAAG